MVETVAILGVVASPHGGGSTTSVVRTLLRGAAEAGAETTLIDVAATPTQAVVEAIEAADAVVFGSPTYRASHTSLLAGLLEQIERGMKYETSAPLQGKATAIVMTGAAGEHFLATEGLRTKLSAFFATQVLSPSLFIQPCAFGADKEMTSVASEVALLHGAALTELATATKCGKALSQLEPLI